MPHSIFFTPAGHAIHGSNATRRLGSPASHGCIRIAPANAAKLFALVSAEGLSNTKVVVTGGQVGRVARASDTSSATASPQTGTGLRRGGLRRALLPVPRNTGVCLVSARPTAVLQSASPLGERVGARHLWAAGPRRTAFMRPPRPPRRCRSRPCARPRHPQRSGRSRRARPSCQCSAPSDAR